MAKGWKTFIFGLALVVVGFMQQFDWATVIPTQYVGTVVAAIGIIAMYLRSVTNTPIFKAK